MEKKTTVKEHQLGQNCMSQIHTNTRQHSDITSKCLTIIHLDISKKGSICQNITSEGYKAVYIIWQKK